jgi:DNA-binding beta-propeller fold protein YncE
VLATIATGPDSNLAQKIALHPTNGRAYVPHVRSNVGLVVLATNRAVNLPFDVAFSADGARLYVAGSGSADLAVVDLAAAAVLANAAGPVGERPVPARRQRA